MTLPSARDWLFSAKAFFASMLALYIALAFDLPRPYWSMAAVYVVANPLAGATSSKAMYRTLGTLLGAAGALILTPLLVNSPLLLSLAVALWVGCMLYVSMLDRTPRSYVFMLAAITLPLIALPCVDAPEAMFDVATARSQEIILGIICASIVAAVVFPMSIGTMLSSRIQNWLTDAAAWADEILLGEGAVPSTPVGRQKLAADISGLDMLISQLSYDAQTRGVTRQARELRGRLLLLLPLLSSLADRLHALKASTNGLPTPLTSLLKEIAAWLAETARPEEAKQLREKLATLKPRRHAIDWDSLLLYSALSRVKEIVDLWHDCLVLSSQIAAGQPLRNAKLAFLRRRTVGETRHYDHVMLAFYAGSAVVATLVASTFWIYSGWAEGSGFVLMTVVGCAFFAAQDRPAPLILSMFVWCTISVMAAGVYLFAILPMVNDFAMLVLVLAPPFLLIGTIIPRPQFSMLGMLLTVNTASFVALGNRYSADFTSFAGAGLASVAGIGFSLLWTLIARPFGGEIAGRRLVLAGWLDLAELAAGRRADDHVRLSGRMLDRLGQLVPRFAAIEAPELGTLDGYAEIRLSLNILELQRTRKRLSPDERDAVGDVLAGISELYGERARRHAVVESSPILLERTDHALRLIRDGEGSPVYQIIDALVGIRRALFPHTPPPVDQDLTPSSRARIAAV